MRCPQWAGRLAAVAVAATTGIGVVTGPAFAEGPTGPSAGSSVSTPTGPSAGAPAGAGPSATATEPGRDPSGEGDAHQVVISVHGTTVTAGGEGKAGILSVYNQGPNNVVGVGIDFDLGALNRDRVDFEVQPAQGCRAPSKDGIACPSIAARRTLEVPFRLTPAPDAEPGPAGMITAVVSDSLHNGIDAPQHVETFLVSIAPSGADLIVWAPDQPSRADGTTGTIKRGGNGDLSILIENQGDRTVQGVRVTTELVDGATFTPVTGCTTSSGKQTLTCEFTDLSLIPADQDTDPGDDQWSAVEFTPGVHIAADAKSPKGWPDLPGNTVTVEALAVAPESAAKRAATSAAKPLPGALHGVAAKQVDNDATDNTDDFTIMLASAGGTSGGDGDTGGQGGGSGGGLPITGAPVMVVAAVGLAVLLVGALLLVLTRRRRIVND